MTDEEIGAEIYQVELLTKSNEEKTDQLLETKLLDKL